MEQMDERRIRRGLALLEMSAGALGLASDPSRRGLAAFAELARGLAERAPAGLRPWPVLDIELAAEDDGAPAALALERRGSRLAAREAPPAPDHVAIGVVLEYYLHLVHDHLRAHRRPGGVATLLPREQAGMTEAFEELEPILRGAAGRERLDGLWATLAAPA
jgi:hypothetical protein